MPPRKQSIVARFDPNPSHYVLAEMEFDKICEVAKIPERENVLFLLGLFIPCLLNLIAHRSTEGEFVSAEFLANLVFAAVAVVVGLIEGKGWYRKRGAYLSLIANIKNRPESDLAYSQPPQKLFVSAAELGES